MTVEKVRKTKIPEYRNFGKNSDNKMTPKIVFNV